MKLFITIACICLSVIMAAQSDPHKLLRKGDKDYETSSWSDAEENYRKANAVKESYRGHYNLGNTIYRQQRYEEAVKQFEDALQRSSKPEQLSKAYHNLGNALYNQQIYDQSVDAYKNALRLDPNDWDTKKNLVMAMKKLQQQRQQQQQQQESEEDQSSEQQQQQPSQANPISDEDQQDQQENPLEKADAEQLLKIAEREDQRVQEKLKKSTGKKKKTEKDW